MLTYARTETVSESARRTPPVEFLAGAWLVSYSSDNRLSALEWGA